MNLWNRDGETSVIPGTDGKCYLSSDKFIIETYQKIKKIKFSQILFHVLVMERSSKTSKLT